MSNRIAATDPAWRKTASGGFAAYSTQASMGANIA
jgi:hypothetical protein